MASASRKPIFYVGGNKGGVAKSWLSYLLVDYIFTQFPSTPIILFETDSSGYDVGVCYKKRKDNDEFNAKYERVKVVGVDLATFKGWKKMFDLIREHPECVAVINSAAASINVIKENGSFFDGAREEYGFDLITFWLLNTEQYGIKALVDFLASIKTSTVHVIKNLYFGDPDDFTEYDTSPKIQQEIAARSGLVLEFPVLEKTVARDLRLAALPIDEARKGMDLLSRTCIDRWRSRFQKMVEQVVAGVLNA